MLTNNRLFVCVQQSGKMANKVANDAVGMHTNKKGNRITYAMRNWSKVRRLSCSVKQTHTNTNIYMSIKYSSHVCEIRCLNEIVAMSIC